MEQGRIYLVTPVATQKLVDDYIDSNATCFGIDAGVLLCKDKKGFIGGIGDFDSVNDNLELTVIPNLIHLNCEKDDTDTKAAIEYVTAQGYKDIVILGGFMGNRVDHLIANFILSYQYDVCWIDEHSYVQLVKHNMEIRRDDYNYFSLYTLEPSVISITKAKYNLDNYLLLPTDSLCVSNTWINNEMAIINVKQGRVILMRTKDN